MHHFSNCPNLSISNISHFYLNNNEVPFHPSYFQPNYLSNLIEKYSTKIFDSQKNSFYDSNFKSLNQENDIVIILEDVERNDDVS